MISSHAHSAVQFHEQLAADWEEKYSRRSFQAREMALLRCLAGSLAPGQRWLDAGCGTGRLSRLLASRGCVVRGVDGSESMIRLAREHATKSPAARQLVFDQIEHLERLELEPQGLDGILCISVLEYLECPEQAISRCAEGLRREGLFVAAVPNRRSGMRRGLSLAYRCTRMLGGKGWPAYLEFSRHEYTRASFELELARFDLKMVSTTYFGGPFPSAIQNCSLIGPLMMCVARKQ